MNENNRLLKLTIYTEKELEVLKDLVLDFYVFEDKCKTEEEYRDATAALCIRIDQLEFTNTIKPKIPGYVKYIKSRRMNET